MKTENRPTMWRSIFGKPAGADAPAKPETSVAPTSRSLDVFIVRPKNRVGETLRIEKNLDGRHWTSRAGATGALAEFEYKHPEVEGTMAVLPAKLTFEL